MAAKNCTLTVEALKALVSYDPETGRFTGRRSKKLIGSRHNNVSPNGTAYVNIHVYPYGHMLAHRLAWLYMTGSWPKGCIDHINRQRDDNRFCNLRDVSLSDNQHNRVMAQKSSRTGILGVKKDGNRWVATIKAYRVAHTLGYFKTAEEASAAYMKAKAIYHKKAPSVSQGGSAT